MNFMPYLNVFGIDSMQVACITGAGEPTASTEGDVGCFYMDTNTGDVYRCTKVENDIYTWEKENEGIIQVSHSPTDYNKIPVFSKTGTVAQSIDDAHIGIFKCSGVHYSSNSKFIASALIFQTRYEKEDTESNETVEDVINQTMFSDDGKLRTRTVNTSNFPVTDMEWETVDISSMSNLLSKIETHANNSDNPHNVTKEQVGLSNVDNTSDIDKPVSSATQTALVEKEDIVNKSTVIDNTADDTKYPTTKAVVDYVENEVDNVVLNRLMPIFEISEGQHNILNPDNFESGYYETTLEKKPSTNHMRTITPIPISEGITKLYEYINIPSDIDVGTDALLNIMFLDSDGAFIKNQISKFYLFEDSSSALSENVPSNTTSVHVWISGVTRGIDITHVCISETEIDEYEPYTNEPIIKSIKPEMVDYKEEISNKVSEITEENTDTEHYPNTNAVIDYVNKMVPSNKKEVLSDNKFDGIFDTEGYYIDVVADSPTFDQLVKGTSFKCTSRYISIFDNPVTEYTLCISKEFTTKSMCIVFYDENKNYISHRVLTTSTSPSTLFTYYLTSGAKYFRLHVEKTYDGQIFISPHNPSNIEFVNYEYIESVDQRDKLKGKTIVNFGDSIFGNYRYPNDISTEISRLTDATVHNCGFGGCRMAKHTIANFDAFSMKSLVSAIVSNDFSIQDAAIESGKIAETEGTGKLPSYFENTLALLKSIDFTDVDIITIAYGTNDFAGNIVIDDETNLYNTDCFAGALRYSIETLLNTYPHLKIFICSQTYRFWADKENDYAFINDSDTRTRNDGKMLTDFVEKTKEVAVEYRLPYIDNYYSLGMNKFNRSIYFSKTDGTHPLLTGRRLIAEHIASNLVDSKTDVASIYEFKKNKSTIIDDTADDIKYPTTKAVADYVENATMLQITSLSGKRNEFTIVEGSGDYLSINGDNRVLYGADSTNYTDIAKLIKDHIYFLYVNFDKLAEFSLTVNRIKLLTGSSTIAGTIKNVYQPTNNEACITFVASKETLQNIQFRPSVTMSNNDSVPKYYCIIDVTDIYGHEYYASQLYEYLNSNLEELGTVGISTIDKLSNKLLYSDKTGITNIQDKLETNMQRVCDSISDNANLIFGEPVFSKNNIVYTYNANESYKNEILSEIDVVELSTYTVVYTGATGFDTSNGGLVAYYYDESNAKTSTKLSLNGSGTSEFTVPKGTVRCELAIQKVAAALETGGTIKITTLGVYRHESDVPPYFVSHLSEKEDIIRDKNTISAINGDSFIWITDYHLQTDDRTNPENSPSLIKHIMDNTNTRFVAFGGDSFTNYYSGLAQNDRDKILTGVRNFYNKFKKSFDFLQPWKFRKVIGNHEWNNPGVSEDYALAQLTPNEVYSYYYKENEDFTVFSPNGMNYYFDNKTQKIRYFCLGCNEAAKIVDDTYPWLLEQFVELPEDYSVIILTHSALSLDGTKSNQSTLMGALATLKTGGDYVYSEKTYTLLAHDVIGIISGDIHRDANIVESGINIIATTADSLYQDKVMERTLGTVTEHAFDVINIDKTNRKIYLTRIGAGEDREIDF